MGTRGTDGSSSEGKGGWGCLVLRFLVFFFFGEGITERMFLINVF